MQALEMQNTKKIKFLLIIRILSVFLPAEMNV